MPMLSKRPEPLSDDTLEPTVHAAPNAGATLLGRTNNHLMPPSGMRKGAADAPLWHIASPAKQQPSPVVAAEAPSCLATPVRCCFTPLATPSPSARLAVFEQLRLAAVLKTPQASGPLLAVPPAAGSGAAATSAVRSNFVQLLGEGNADTPEQLGSNSHRVEIMGSPVPVNSSNDEDEESDNDSEDGTPDQLQAQQQSGEVPQPPPGAEHPSLGSEGHALGTCKRCCFFPRGRCMNGYECEFCHYEHEKRKRKNKKKSKKVVSGSPRPALSATARPFMPSIAPPPAAMSVSSVTGSHYPLCAASAPAPMVPVQASAQDLVFGCNTAAMAPMTLPGQANCHVTSGLMPQQGCMMNASMQGTAMPMQQQHQDVLVSYPANAMPMQADMQVMYQVPDGTCHMMQPAQMAADQQPCAVQQQYQPCTHVVMLEPAYMSQGAQPAPAIAAPPSAPAEPPRLPGAEYCKAPAFADVPPPPVQSPRLFR